MRAIRGVALTVRFALELCLLAAVGLMAWTVIDSGWRWVVAVLAIVAVSVIWGLFLSPKAAVSLPGWAALLIEAALFLGAGLGLWLLEFRIVAILGVVVWAVDRAVLALTKP
ncbi:MAG: DUF2568 domain-containing protein [Micrococcaceae bacterium]